ncbi:hypothetical protein [Massilia violaceinigra]|nr:hypothetical protein [Massilia violaceinigra]
MKTNTQRMAFASCAPLGGIARPVFTALLGLAAATMSAGALADANTAKTNFFANMDRAGVTFPGVNASTAKMVPAQVKGLYGIYSPKGNLISVTNEAGTLTGKAGGFSSVGLEPGKPRPMSPQQVAGLRAEIMANIDYDKLIKTSYGNGGGRKILMFSALDCPGCNQLEKALHKAAPTLNTTFYIVPGSLRDSSSGGIPWLEKVARIRCDDNAGQAWQTYWTKRTLPAARACALTPERVELDNYLMSHIMDGIKVMKPAYPMLVSEDGKWLPLPRGMTSASISAVFGPESKPAAVQAPAQWLAAAPVAGKSK